MKHLLNQKRLIITIFPNFCLCDESEKFVSPRDLCNLGYTVYAYSKVKANKEF